MAPFLLQKHINRRKRVKRRLCGFIIGQALAPPSTASRLCRRV